MITILTWYLMQLIFHKLPIKLKKKTQPDCFVVIITTLNVWEETEQLGYLDLLDMYV